MTAGTNLGLSVSTPARWDASPSQVTSHPTPPSPPPAFPQDSGTWVERGTVRVKCLAQEHNTMTQLGLEPGPLDPESSALTIGPPRLYLVRLGLILIQLLNNATRILSKA